MKNAKGRLCGRENFRKKEGTGKPRSKNLIRTTMNWRGFFETFSEGKSCSTRIKTKNVDLLENAVEALGGRCKGMKKGASGKGIKGERKDCALPAKRYSAGNSNVEKLPRENAGKSRKIVVARKKGCRPSPTRETTRRSPEEMLEGKKSKGNVVRGPKGRTEDTGFPSGGGEAFHLLV